MDYIKLIGGLILLVLSGDFLVKGGVAVAKKFKVSTLVVGMTVVAFGTSAPEFIVSLQAALNGNSEIAVGNVVGSNIANIGLILGLTALVSPLIVARNSIKIDWPIMMLSTLLFFVAAMDGTVTRIEGIIGFCALLVFVVWQIKTSRNNNQDNETESNEKQLKMWLAAIFIIGSCFGLAFGARILIEGASNIAKSFGVSERVIGITIVAFGTSLPELAASLSAAIKKEADIAIGNIIGSNLFNILSVIGLTAAIKPINIQWNNFSYDFYWMILFAVILILFILPIKRLLKRNKNKQESISTVIYSNARLGRLGGLILVITYVTYIFTLF